MRFRLRRLDPIAGFYAASALLLGLFGAFEVARGANPEPALWALGGGLVLFLCAALIEIALARLTRAPK
jgi:hypothetical protein